MGGALPRLLRSSNEGLPAPAMVDSVALYESTKSGLVDVTPSGTPPSPYANRSSMGTLPRGAKHSQHAGLEHRGGGIGRRNREELVPFGLPGSDAGPGRAFEASSMRLHSHSSRALPAVPYAQPATPVVEPEAALQGHLAQGLSVSRPWTPRMTHLSTAALMHGLERNRTSHGRTLSRSSSSGASNDFAASSTRQWGVPASLTSSTSAASLPPAIRPFPSRQDRSPRGKFR